MKSITKILKLEQKLEKNKNTKIEEMDVSKIKNVKRDRERNHEFLK